MNWLQASLLREARLRQEEDSGATARGDETGTSEQDLKDAREAVEATRAEESRSLSGVDALEPFFPRTPIASLIQSRLHQHYVEKGLVQAQQGHGLASTNVAVTNLSLSPQALQGPQNRLFRPFEQTDAGWVSCKIAEGIARLRGPHPFSDNPARVRIGNNARVILISDWATSIPRARLIGTRMRQQLLHPSAANRELHVIHLGDVYYSGYASEFDDHFLSDWPVFPGEEGRIGSWALNGNHEMYSGGHDYFQHLLRQPRLSRQNGCSYFCLENDNWQVFGLDTAYSEYDLHGNQAAWVEQVRSERPETKAMMLSHHQVFSLYGEQDSPAVEDRLQTVLDTGKVRAWFWGHEHRCAIYEPRHRIQSPRLIGHGGVPAWAPSKPKPMGVEFEYADFVQSGLEKFQKFGFAVLDFEGDRVGVNHVGEDGQTYWPEILT